MAALSATNPYMPHSLLLRRFMHKSFLLRPFHISRSSTGAALAASLLLAACSGSSDSANSASDGAAAPTYSAPTKVAELTGFSTPESALFDAERDVWYITNINGVPNDLDNNGFISRVSGDLATVDTQFIAAGKNGVTLHGPKGMALVGDTLWVADINTVRGFDATTGSEVASIAVEGAVFLNDIAAATDGSLYISDTGIRFGTDGMSHPGPDRIFKLAGREVFEALRFEGDPGPNGLAFGADGKLIIVPFATGTISSWDAGSSAADSIAAGPGGFDGVLSLPDGRVLVSSWTDSTVHVLSNGKLTSLIRNVPAPADIGFDASRGNLAIPLFELGRLEVWSVVTQ